MAPIISPTERDTLQGLLNNAQQIIITAHQNPDGDAVGSTTALQQVLRRLGKEATIVMPNDFPDFLRWIPGANEIVRCNKQADEAAALLAKADLVFCLDYNAPHRTGDEMGTALTTSEAKMVMVDHHLDPADFCAVTVSHPEMCSTCEVLLHLMNAMGWSEGLTHDEATSLYVGMMTDTGAFTYASSRPEVYECISQLLRCHIDKDKIYRNVFWTGTEGRYRIMGYLLYVKMELLHRHHASLITLTNQEYRQFKLKNGDTEGFVNIPLEIDGINLSVFLREDTEVKGKIRVSTRSVDDIPCNEMCAEFFNGGGHKNAAGGSLMCTLEEAADIARKAIAKYGK
ncbi:MAG: DHH family phosphoesterase [Bacteroidaceae bacterium]|nr:DHH family phosphoesterase [Bacteroidaceae bacterium]